MSRPKDPDTQYRMKLFVSNNRRYAATANPCYNAKKKWVSNITIWGKLTEKLVFEPNLRFLLLTEEEKRKYIFPEGWDISSAFQNLTRQNEEEREIYNREEQYKVLNDRDVSSAYKSVTRATKKDVSLNVIISSSLFKRLQQKSLLTGRSTNEIVSQALFKELEK